MNLEKLRVQNIEIKLVDNEDALLALSKKLQQTTCFGFDTEFDRFYREYGFKLFLIQIFDGETCYLVDPLALKNLSVLWKVFEDDTICKVAYSCSEDVQLLKINGCFIKNIFDLQMVAKLCNHAANSFSDLVLDLYGVTLDKSMQKSNWRTRPLNNAQQIYASNDVIWLLKLQDYFNKIAAKNGLAEMIAEENKYCEDVVVNEYSVKLSPKQMATFSIYHQKMLLNLFNVRNKIAEEYNMPPFYVVSDITLEDIVENSTSFKNDPFKKGFCNKLLNDEPNKELFYTAIDEIDATVANVPAKKTYSPSTEKKYFQVVSKENVENKCKQISDVVLNKYGQTASEYILRGLKKSLQQMPFSEIKLKKYQHKIITEACNQLNIDL